MGKHYPSAYIQYLVHFHTDRDFFECHEVLEEYWKETKGDVLGPVWVGLIQLAVGLYHHRRGNQAGARKMLSSSAKKLGAHMDKLESLGIMASQCVEEIDRRATLVQQSDLPIYTDMNIPLQDEELLQECIACSIVVPWNSPSDMKQDAIIHKHLYRDRSEVVEARRKALHQKGR